MVKFVLLEFNTCSNWTTEKLADVLNGALKSTASKYERTFGFHFSYKWTGDGVLQWTNWYRE